MSQPAHVSPQSRQILQVLQQAVAKALEKKRRLGQYAVVWQNGAPVKVGGEVNDQEIPSLLAEKTFLERQLAETPESAQLTRMSTLARLKKIETLLTQLNEEQR